MQISVIIPTFNEERNIGKTVRRILDAHAATIMEIIVVDGGSEDDTVRLAKEAGASVISSPQKGRGAQMDFGARQSRGDVLYFVHADVLPPASFAADIEAALQKGWLMGNFQYCFDSDRPLLRLNAYFTRFRWFFTQGGDRTFFIRRETYFGLGGYDPNFVAMEEYDFLRRAKRAGYDFAMLPCKCTVSARKYERNSWLRVQIANFVAYNLWARGLATPQRVREVYGRMLR
ncbi:MAG: glycosyltransferase [Bacteroidetes bacterium]|nr:glycosyltransferase [Bacteroidota bacterium]